MMMRMSFNTKFFRLTEMGNGKGRGGEGRGGEGKDTSGREEWIECWVLRSGCHRERQTTTSKTTGWNAQYLGSPL